MRGRRSGPFATIAFLMLALLLALPAPKATASDGSGPLHRWHKVADGGLAELTPGAPPRPRVEDVVVWRENVYVASHHVVETMTVPVIFRSGIHGTHVWEATTPDWTDPGTVVEMVPFNDSLFVGTFDGRLWRLAPGDVWHEIAPALPGTLRAMAPWVTPSGVARLCLAYEVAGNVSITCSHVPENGEGWVGAPPVDTGFTPPSVSLAALTRGPLYLGYGAQSFSPSERCHVVALPSLGHLWTTVDHDCFGFESVAWVSSMKEFDGWLYIGTGGHVQNVPVVRVRPGVDPQVVTPVERYPDCFGAEPNPFAPCPVRYGSMAVMDSQLYVGTRTSPATGDVLVRDRSGRWEHSNEPGFGDGADAVAAIASESIYVYAAAIHPEGFQVWRRQPTTIDHLSVRLPPLISLLIPGPLMDLGRFGECLLRPCPPFPFDPFETINPVIDGLLPKGLGDVP